MCLRGAVRLMLNAISVDVEEYFHVEAFAGIIDPKSWGDFESRVERSVDRILRLFQDHGTSGDILHSRLGRRTPARSRQENCRCRTRNRLPRFRPPAHPPADSRSVPPGHPEIPQSIDGIGPQAGPLLPGAKLFRHKNHTVGTRCSRRRRIQHRFLHFPRKARPLWHARRQTVSLLGNDSRRESGYLNSLLRPFGWQTIIGQLAGGGYLRLFPYRFTRRAIRRLNDRENQPAMVYFHPWELDPSQPRVSAPLRSRLRHYVNLSKTENQIERLLKDFRFSTVSEVCSQLEAYRRTSGLTTHNQTNSAAFPGR